MGSINFLNYLNKFERAIAVGVAENVVGKDALVNTRNGRLTSGKFARYMGEKINSLIPFVIDYYGYSKRSQGFIDLITEEKSISDRQVKSIQTRVVYFASLKIEEISDITTSHYLRGGFSEFKKEILYWRGFEKTNKKKVMEEPVYRGEDK